MARYLLNSNLLFAALLNTGVLVHARASPSGTPTSYVCPSQDTAGFSLGIRSESTNPIFCSYPTFPGENPSASFCTYSMTTGVLIQDQDGGHCPASAVPVSTKNKLRKSAHAPLPTRPKNVGGGVPDGAADKVYLKKRHAVPAAFAR